jgi:excisionase family DNA binding protein
MIVAARKKQLDLDADILTLNEVAAYLRCSTSTVYRLLKTGELRAFKVGYWRVRRSALDAWIVEKVKVSKTAIYPTRVKK